MIIRYTLLVFIRARALLIQNSSAQNSQGTWASWSGGVGFCLFSELFASKNFLNAAGSSSERHRKPLLSQDRHSKRERQSSPSLLLLLRMGNRRRRGRDSSTGKTSFMSKHPGADPQSTEVIQNESLTHQNAPEQVSHWFRLPDAALGAGQKCLFLIQTQEPREDWTGDGFLSDDKHKFFSTI